MQQALQLQRLQHRRSALYLPCFFLSKKIWPFTIKKSDFRLNPQCKRFLQIGLPLALQEFLTQLSFLALCAFVNRLGLEASSGYGVACKIVNFAMLVPSSLMQSMASFVSQNVGAGKKKTCKTVHVYRNLEWDWWLDAWYLCL